MDFPIVLNKGEFIHAMEEFKQDLKLLLKEPILGYLQSSNIGALFDVHASDEQLVETGIRNTVQQMNGVEITYLEVRLPLVRLAVKYMDDIVKFQFSVEEYENTLRNHTINR